MVKSYIERESLQDTGIKRKSYKLSFWNWLIIVGLLLIIASFFVSAETKDWTGTNLDGTTYTNYAGLVYYAKADAVVNNVSQFTGANATECYLYNGSLQMEKNASFVGTICNINYSVTNGNTYYIFAGSRNQIYKLYYSTLTAVYSGTLFNISNKFWYCTTNGNGCSASGAAWTVAYAINNITVNYPENASPSIPAINITVDYPPNNTVFNYSTALFNVSTNNNASSCNITINNTLYNMINQTGVKWYYNESGLVNGTYPYYFSCNDNASIAYSGNYTFLVNIPAPPNSINFSYQVPANLTTLILIDRELNVTYNYSITAFNISSPTINISLNNSAGWFINGTQTMSFSENWSGNFNNFSYSFILDDDDIYPGIFNLPNELMETTTHDVTILATQTDAVRINFLNISTTTTYNIFEVMANTTGTMSVWYCNSSYISGTFTTNGNCTQFATLNSTGFNHTESIYSSYQLSYFPVVNGMISTVGVTSNGSFIVRGNNGVAVGNVFSINVSSRAVSMQTTANTGTLWTNQPNKTVDAHLHQYFGNESLIFFACGTNTSNGVFCSSPRTNYFNISIIPPSSPSIITPYASQPVYQYLNISWIPSITSSNTTFISSYTIMLYRHKQSDIAPTFNQTIIVLDTNNTFFTPNDAISMNGTLIKNVTVMTWFSGTGDRKGKAWAVFNYTDGTTYSTGYICDTTTPSLRTFSNFYTNKYVNNVNIFNTFDSAPAVCAGGNVGTYYAANLSVYSFNFSPSFYWNSFLNNLAPTNYSINIIAQSSSGNTGQAFSDDFLLLSNTVLNLTPFNNVTLANIGVPFDAIVTDTNTAETYNFSTNLSIMSLYLVRNHNYSIILSAGGYVDKTFDYNTPTSIYTTYSIGMFASNSVYYTVVDELSGLAINRSALILMYNDFSFFNATTDGGNVTNSVFIGNITSGLYTVQVSCSGYADKFYYLTISNTTTMSLVARLLNSSLTTVIGANVKTITYQAIPDALITVQRQYFGGSFATVVQGLTDINGFTTLNVQVSNSYRIIISAPGYSIKQFDQIFYAANSPYTFILSGTSVTPFTNYLEGVNYLITPQSTIINNVTPGILRVGNNYLVNFSINAFNATFTVEYVAVQTPSILVNVSGSPGGGQAQSQATFADNYSGTYNVTYYLSVDGYPLIIIPYNYWIDFRHPSSININDALHRANTDIANVGWLSILGVFIVLVGVILITSLGGSPVVGSMVGVVITIFLSVVGWFNPVFTGFLVVINLLMMYLNRQY